MKIERIEIGLIPYGPAVGDRAIIVHVNDEPNGDAGKDEAEKMYVDLKAISSQDPVLKAAVDSAFIAQTQFYFQGMALVDPKNAASTRRFFEIISVDSLNRQRDSVHVTKVHPPFLGYIGKPTVFSGNNNFYEQFNYLIIDCALKGINESNLLEYYRDFAMIEIARHQFCSFEFMIENETDIKNFEKFYRDRNVIDIDPRRVYLIPATTSKENIEYVAEYCIKTGYRFGLDMSQYSDLVQKTI